jgi:hypothetical protein
LVDDSGVSSTLQVIGLVINLALIGRGRGSQARQMKREPEVVFAE